jgi:hypothetical protein
MISFLRRTPTTVWAVGIYALIVALAMIAFKNPI